MASPRRVRPAQDRVVPPPPVSSGVAASLSVDTTDALGAVVTATTLLDNEVDRLTRLLGARDAVQSLTEQVRVLAGTVQPLQARKDALEQEIARLETASTLLQRQLTDEQHQAGVARQQHFDALTQQRADLAAAETTTAQALAKLAAEVQAAEDDAKHQKEVIRQELSAAMQEAQTTHQARRQVLTDELTALEAQVKEATLLRDRLTAIRPV